MGRSLQQRLLHGAGPPGPASTTAPLVREAGHLFACVLGLPSACCENFGHPSANSSVAPTVPGSGQANHPIWSNVFGTENSVLMGATLGYFDDATGATVVGVDSDDPANPTVLVKSVGLGRVILLADANIIADFEPPNSISMGPDINNANDVFLANLFAYAGSLVQ